MVLHNSSLKHLNSNIKWSHS